MEDTVLQRYAGGAGQVAGNTRQEKTKVCDPVALVVVLQFAQETIAAPVENPTNMPFFVIVVQDIRTFGYWLSTDSTDASLTFQDYLPVDGDLGVGELGDALHFRTSCQAH